MAEWGLGACLFHAISRPGVRTCWVTANLNAVLLAGEHLREAAAAAWNVRECVAVAAIGKEAWIDFTRGLTALWTDTTVPTERGSSEHVLLSCVYNAIVMGWVKAASPYLPIRVGYGLRSRDRRPVRAAAAMLEAALPGWVEEVHVGDASAVEATVRDGHADSQAVFVDLSEAHPARQSTPTRRGGAPVLPLEVQRRRGGPAFALASGVVLVRDDDGAKKYLTGFFCKGQPYVVDSEGNAAALDWPSLGSVVAAIYLRDWTASSHADVRDLAHVVGAQLDRVAQELRLASRGTSARTRTRASLASRKQAWSTASTTPPAAPTSSRTRNAASTAPPAPPASTKTHHATSTSPPAAPPSASRKAASTTHRPATTARPSSAASAAFYDADETVLKRLKAIRAAAKRRAPADPTRYPCGVLANDVLVDALGLPPGTQLEEQMRAGTGIGGVRIRSPEELGKTLAPAPQPGRVHVVAVRTVKEHDMVFVCTASSVHSLQSYFGWRAPRVSTYKGTRPAAARANLVARIQCMWRLGGRYQQTAEGRAYYEAHHALTQLPAEFYDRKDLYNTSTSRLRATTPPVEFVHVWSDIEYGRPSAEGTRHAINRRT